MKSNFIMKNLRPPLDMKNNVNKEYCYNNFLSCNNTSDILSKNITELRKGDFEEITTGQQNANIIRLPTSKTNGGAVWIEELKLLDVWTVEIVSLNSNNLSILADKLTEIEIDIVRFGSKVSADTTS